MILVADLRIDTEILPLFNRTRNTWAEAALRALLLEMPATLPEVKERQQIVRGYSKHLAVINFSYSQLQLHEVRNFLDQVGEGRQPIATNKLRVALKLWLSEEAKYQIHSRYAQVILFLHQLEQQFLLRLRLSEFPVAYQRHLQEMLQFLAGFRLKHFASLIQAGKFITSHIIHFGQFLLSIDKQQLADFWRRYFEAEAFWSVAECMEARKFTFPEFQDSQFHLQGFYHPLLAGAVRNTLEIEPGENVLLLTGPNMSGKSTLLKAVGLCVYLARIGVGVPAERFKLPFFQHLVVAINLQDSLQNGYSHFMMELQQLKSMVLAARDGKPVFAIFDELFRGTNVDDALAITQATIAGLINFPNAYTIISTHLLDLQDTLPANVVQYNIGCTLEAGRPVFNYRLEPGWSSIKIGQVLFAQAGLPELLRKAPE